MVEEGNQGRGKTWPARGSEKYSNEVSRTYWQEKQLDLKYFNPYRKPTQVDRERILRRAGEALLRNSAKWSRNFGRRDAELKCSAAVNRPEQLFIKNTGLC